MSRGRDSPPEYHIEMISVRIIQYLVVAIFHHLEQYSADIRWQLYNSCSFIWVMENTFTIGKCFSDSLNR